ncbi:MAG: PQQ-binding-like beta-propeller repeat protein, partial [Steroidobacteraceae bacterium]
MALLVLAMSAASAAPPGRQSDDDESQWGSYGGDPGGNRHSPLTQINRQNVGKLAIAWTYRTGELGADFARADTLTFEATPILVRGSLYLSTATNIVIALDPATGQQRWRYDPRIDRARRYSEATSRGVSSWVDASAEPTAACAHRILVGTLDARLIALDGRTGRPCRDFGNGGKVDLNEGVRESSAGNYLVTSPPAIYRNIVIVGSAIGDNGGVELPRGIVRAFDVRSGKQLWSWDPIPTSGEAAPRRGWQPQSAQRTGAANAWSVLSVDAGRGLVFIPTGSASPDYFGGERSGDNRYANSLVALHAATGALAWHRQLVHHDLWDYDVPAQPMLIDIERDNKAIPAVVQATKSGMLFVFDRETGEPVFEVVERPVPQSDVAGEVSSPTQPFPATPALVSQAAVTAQDAWGLTFYDRGKCRELISQY